MLFSNQDIIKKRWPTIWHGLYENNTTEHEYKLYPSSDGPDKTFTVNGIHLTSSYDKAAEAGVLSGRIPEGNARAIIYGFGMGDLARELLKRKEMKELNIFIMNRAIVGQILENVDCADWLGDSRVHLHFAYNETEIELPFCVVPPCLKLAEKECFKLADKLMLELNTSFISEKFKEDENKYKANIDKNTKYIEKDSGYESLLSVRQDKAMVVGAGPSLGRFYDWIKKKRQEFFLIAVDGALCPLLKQSLVPDVVVCLDGREAAIKLFECQSEKLKDTTLVYFPLVQPKIVAQWPGHRVVTYANHKIYHKINTLYPRAKLYASGSVIHPATDLAVKLGARKIYFIGADFSYPDNMTHVDGFAYNSKVNKTGKAFIENGYGNLVETTPNLKGYLVDMERYIKLHPEVEFINVCKAGALITGTKYEEIL